MVVNTPCFFIFIHFYIFIPNWNKMSDLFFHHPYKYDGSDSDTDKEESKQIIESDPDVQSDEEEDSIFDSESESDDVDSEEEREQQRQIEKQQRRQQRKLLKEQEEQRLQREQENIRKLEREERKQKKLKSKSKSRPDQDEKKKPSYNAETDVESNGEDDSCVAMSIHFVSVIKKTIEEEDADALKETLKKTPIAVVLHYLHYIFHIVNHDPDMVEIVKHYNDRYNIVSRYFLKALKDPEKTKRVMKSLVKVSDALKNRVDLDEIDDLLHFTPEFIVMVTIQSGNLESHDKIIEEWELSERFMRVRDLIAAFFGIKRYFSNPDRAVERRDLIVSAIAGGSIKTLSKIVRKTSDQYLTEYTLRKVRAICIPNLTMMEYLQKKHGLEFS